MHAILQNNLFFIKEHIGIFKAANNFDIFDPSTNQKIIECREPDLGTFTRFLRFTDFKRMTPFHVILTTPEGQKLLSLKRGISIFKSYVEVFDENDMKIGEFEEKFFSIGGEFNVVKFGDAKIYTLQGNLISWEFRFLQGEKIHGYEELANVSKKWAGLGKELFTSADNYMLTINNDVQETDSVRILMLAAVMYIDFVFNESSVPD
jgi:uncharacterized protein YxjI